MARASGYQRATPEHVWRWKLKNRYGLTAEEYEAILESQGGGCAICEKTPEEAGKRLSVDHDHETGDVRGLLCQSCNLALGMIEDHLDAALAYLAGVKL